MKKVLIIDDEEYFCRALKKNLELKAVCRALAATTGEEGIRLADVASALVPGAIEAARPETPAGPDYFEGGASGGGGTERKF